MFKYIKAYFLGNAILVDFSWQTKNKQKQLNITCARYWFLLVALFLLFVLYNKGEI